MEVQVEETCFVVPNKKTPTHGLWLSSLDINMLSVGHTPLVYFYCSNSKNASSGFFDIGKLKKALSKTLVPFYPLAGRLGVDSNGRVEIKCNDEGVLFVAARSELSIDDLKDMIKPSLELKSLFIPQIDSAKSPCVVLAVQVTFLRCGGAAVGLAIHHVVVDGPSTFHFLQTWAALARDGDNAVVELPCHDRTLLRACSLAAIHPDTLSVICLKQNLSDTLGPITTKVFSISKHQATSLKRLCGTSTFCAVSAHLWQCMCLAVPCSAAASGCPGMALLPGEHPAAHKTSSPQPLLWLCGRRGGHERRGEGHPFGGAGRCRRTDKGHGGQGRR